ncbi:hypothetical protein HH308_06190 [Gordonia sp. TBRC 11910]|uniref:Uncharacterized protein n=1 Tax=Gordonia asplenii TaxID=2725283 RepID=A0A848KX87_9ACTN|nr:hypothetical protein [Gordonia asplenii]NMO00801.1 hypothetical protein [Gordonia asplenii]
MLMQVVQEGFSDTDRGPVDWLDHVDRYEVPEANRSRIIEREKRFGFTPGDDGWLTTYRQRHTRWGFGGFIHWQRFRWEDV